VRKLILKAKKGKTLLDNIHELGRLYWQLVSEGDKGSQAQYRVVYFSQNCEVHFEGELTEAEANKIKGDGNKASIITFDEFNSEIVIEE